MTPDDMPACVCSAHPAGDDRRKYMIVAEETREHVVFCCRRCTEVTRVAVIQVRTLAPGRNAARHVVAQQRRAMDPRLLRMLEARKRGGMRVTDIEGK